jgi:hypothetical protein
MFIPDPTFFHPGSRIRTFSIPYPGSSSKNLSILTPKKAKKWFLSSKKYDLGCSSRIQMLTFSHPGSRIQGSKRHPIPDPGSGSATLIVIITNAVFCKITMGRCVMPIPPLPHVGCSWGKVTQTGLRICFPVRESWSHLST